MNTKTFSLCAAILTILYCLSPSSCLAQSQSQLTEVLPYKGIKNCATSMCHGAVSPNSMTTINHNEYSVWSDKDRHSKAFVNLSSPTAKGIAQRLRLGDPTKERLCLDCHATYSKAVGTTLQYEEGVTCESCHGASGLWLPAHTDENASHARNIELGMTDLVPFEKRALVCMSCHVGTAAADVTHRLLAAGHPRMSFELDTFGLLQPNHWEVDEDYAKRKGRYNPLQAWMLAQRIQSRETLARLRRLTASKKSLIPEASIFYCGSCHRDPAVEDWKINDHKDGEYQLNLAVLKIVAEILETLSKEKADKFRAQIQLLQNSFMLGRSAPIIDALDQQLGSDIRDLFRSAKIDGVLADKLFKQLSLFAQRQSSTYFEDGEQIFMGMQAISASRLSKLSESSNELNYILNLLKNPDKFDSRQLARAVGPRVTPTPAAVKTDTRKGEAVKNTKAPQKSGTKKTLR